MFRGFGLQSAGGCSEARGPTHTAAQTSNVSRIRIFTAFLSMFRTVVTIALEPLPYKTKIDNLLSCGTRASLIEEMDSRLPRRLSRAGHGRVEYVDRKLIIVFCCVEPVPMVAFTPEIQPQPKP